MMKQITSESHKNMIVSASELNGQYLVRLFINGKLHNSFTTVYIEEAQEVYYNTVMEMLTK